jgi:uncharacterized membrane protein
LATTTFTAPDEDVRPVRYGGLPAQGLSLRLDGRVQVALLTTFGLGIRLLIVRGFWLDEATSGYDSRLSYAGMLRQLRHDNHPPLEYTVLWLTAHTIGSTQTDLRLPSIFFGTLLIPMLFVAGRALYNERAGVLAAAFGSVGALAVWYAQEARMYALFMLMVTVTIWAQSRALSTDKRRYWVAWAAACVTLLYTQWFSSLAITVEVFFFLIVFLQGRRTNRAWRKPLLHLTVSVVAVLVLLAPILPLLYTQYRNNQSNGLGFGTQGSGGAAAGLSPYGILNNLVWALFGYHSNAVIAGAVAVWPLGILVVLAVLGRGRGKKRANRQLLVVGFVPMALVFLASGATAANRSLFEVRYFIGLVPVLYLLLAGAAWNLTPNVRARKAFAVSTLAVLSVGLILQQTDSSDPRLYGYDAAFEQISSVAKPGAEILYAPAYLNVDVEYFEPTMHSEPATESVPKLSAAAQVFVVGSFNFAGVSPRSTDVLLAKLQQTRHLDATFKAPNVVVWEFS